MVEFNYQDLNRRLLDDEKLFLFETLKENPEYIPTSLKFAIQEDKNKNFIPFWHLDHFFHAHDEIFLIWMDEWIDTLLKVEHSGCKRSLLRVLVKKKRLFTQEQEGYLLDFAIKHLEDRFEEIAVHAHSMKLLCRLIPKYPEIGQHVKLLVEEDFNNRSSGYKSIGRKLLAIINKNGEH